MNTDRIVSVPGFSLVLLVWVKDTWIIINGNYKRLDALEIPCPLDNTLENPPVDWAIGILSLMKGS